MSIIEEKTAHKRCPDCGVEDVEEADGSVHWYHKQDCKFAYFLVFCLRYKLGVFNTPPTIYLHSECMQDLFDVYEELVVRLKKSLEEHPPNEE